MTIIAKSRSIMNVNRRIKEEVDVYFITFFQVFLFLMWHVECIKDHIFLFCVCEMRRKSEEGVIVWVDKVFFHVECIMRITVVVGMVWYW